MRFGFCLALFALALLAPSAAQADFGIKSLSVSAIEEDGTPALQAGSHPYEFTTSFEIETNAEGKLEGIPRELFFSLPPGMVGDPFAAPRCSASDFEGALVHCPGNTQIGVATFNIVGGVDVKTTPIYNLTPAPGLPASFGTSLASVNGILEASLRSSDYGVDVSDITLPTEVELKSVSVTVWGAPAEASHDPQRQCFPPGVRDTAEVDCASDSAVAPFLTLPTSCTGPLKWTLSVNSLQEPENFQTATVESIGLGGQPVGLHGCGKLPFEPSIDAQPESPVSDSPTGLHFNLDLPQAPVVKVPLQAVSEVQSLQITATSGVFKLGFIGQERTGARGIGDLNSGSTKVENVTTSGNFVKGEAITGPGIPAGTTIKSVESGLQPQTFNLTLTAASTASASGAELVADLPFNAEATAVQGALESLLNIGAGNVAVSGSPGSYLIAFQENLSQQNVPQIKAFAEELKVEDSEGQVVEVGSAAVTVVKQGRRGIPNAEFGVTGEDTGLVTAHLKDAVVTLPPGLALNPSAADGRTGCPLTGPEGINLPGSGEPAQSEPARCPDASKVGTVTAKSPLIDHPVSGALYLAKQGENPFGSLFALYIALTDPQTGVVVKLAGKVEPDPVTGQLRTTFRNNPQLPVEDLDLDIFGGPRAALTTPSTCGTYTTNADLTPWSAPEAADAFPSDPFSITSSPSGACPAGEAQMPFKPSFEAGTATPLAGAYSPFVMRLSRENGSQRVAALNLTMPPGLTGKLAGLAECSEAQIAAAAARSNPGQGALERQSPSCPQASEVGVVNVGAGSGNPIYVQGHAYLAGPYKGAPLSLAIITPAVAGPFDLGTVVVRAALYVDPTTAQITVKSDPLPTMLQGIPLDVRSVAVNVNRDTFTLNPTSCEQMKVGGEAIARTGQVASLANRFQVGGCKGLDFAPKLAISLKGSTKRSKNPALKAVLTQPPGQANIGRVSVVLPKSQFIDQSHINNPCTRVQFNAGAGNGAECPAKSILGKARAYTPLLDKPLEGPVYFRSNGGERELPDLVLSLDGKVHLNVVGFVDSVRRKGTEIARTRSTFATVPDAPVSKFILEMKGGKKGLLENSENLCAKVQRASVSLTAQNGKRSEATPKIATSCGSQAKKRKARRGT